MMSQEKEDLASDVPKNVRWVMKFINNIGFPILCVIWMAYQQYTQGRETIKAFDSFKEVLSSLKNSIDQQNRILRNKNPNSD